MLRISIRLCLFSALFACGSTSGSISGEVIQVQWHLTSLAGEASHSQTQITLRIDRDGSVAGQATVNRYAAENVVSGDGGWSFGNPSTTKRVGTPGEMDEETLFMRLMVRADHWHKHGSKLDLLEGKRVLVTFERDRG